MIKIKVETTAFVRAIKAIEDTLKIEDWEKEFIDGVPVSAVSCYRDLKILRKNQDGVYE